MQTLVVEKVTRKAHQKRSKESQERMLAATRELMLELGSEDFTLQDVSRRGEVSIGSIYLRFESKDNLVRAVIAKALSAIEIDETEMLDKLKQSCSSLNEFVPQYVEAYAEVLRHNAPLLRLCMQRGAHDPLVSEPGKKHAHRSCQAAIAAMLAYQDEFGGDDHALKASTAFHIIFATLARKLSLGSNSEAVDDYDWDLLKLELGRMCLAYLRHA